MAVDKLVDSTQLDSDLTSVANAIRAKSGGSSQLAFPTGFVSEIQALPSGGEYWVTSLGSIYVKDVVLPVVRNTQDLYKYAYNMETVVCNETRLIGGGLFRITNYFDNCTALRSAKFPYLAGIASSFVEFFLGHCPALEEAIFGSVGYPVSEFDNTSYDKKVFTGSSQAGLTITIYVDATSLPDVPSAVSTYAPWGATNATIIYRSSVTGEVLV